MINFTSILVYFESKIEIYSSYSSFSLSRLDFWQRLCSLDQLVSNSLQLTKNKITEEVLGESYGFESNTFEGATLLFGNDTDARICLRNSEIRKALSHPQAEAQVIIRPEQVDVRFTAPENSVFSTAYHPYFTLLPQFQ